MKNPVPLEPTPSVYDTTAPVTAEDDELTTHTAVGHAVGSWIAQSNRSRARILVLAGPEVGRKYVVEHSATIGRATEANIRIDDPQVSRLHSRVMADENGSFVVEDMGSRNGTMVNGSVVEKQSLNFGDRIQVGSHTVLLFTHQDPLEDKVLQRQKMEAIGRLGAGIAHDFNNLLGAVMASMDYLAELPPDSKLSDEEVHECFTDIRMASKRAADLTRRLLGFARRGSSQHGPVDISTLCEEVVHLVQRTFDRSISINSNVDPDIVVTGDRGQLYQVLMNLCINARDAMPGGGVLSVVVRLQGAETLTTVPLSSSTEHAVVVIQDTGVGMDTETRKRVFEPFFTTKSEAGSGLGLATVYEVVSAHGGHVDVQSTPNRGTTFRVLLPAIRQGRRTGTAPTMDRAEAPPTVRPSKTGTILLVDDEPVVRRSAGRLLRQSGHNIIYAKDGREAVEIYRSSSPKPDLVILDLDMPNVSGEEAYERLRAQHPGVQVLFVSGYWDDERERKLQKLGALGFLPKPYDLNSLREAIAKALGEEPPETA
ncbi:MAG: response regulator [Myxococcota bacterium]